MAKFRPDRFATLYFFHPLRRLLRRPAAGIPILMYHGVSETSEPRGSAYFHTRTSPRVFREHLNLLARDGYKTIGLGDAVRRLQQGAGVEEKQGAALRFGEPLGVGYFGEVVFAMMRTA